MEGFWVPFVWPFRPNVNFMLSYPPLPGGPDAYYKPYQLLCSIFTISLSIA